jgi:Kef-type K+ transport system membrane component KefB
MHRLEAWWHQLVQQSEPAAWWALALTLLGATVLGRLVASRLGWPRLIGYSFAGSTAALLGFGIALPYSGVVGLVLDVGLAVVLFDLGSQARLTWLRGNLWLLPTSLLEMALGATAVFAGLFWYTGDLSVAVTCAVLSLPASAVIAARVAEEVGAKGQTTQRLKLMTVLNTLAAAVATSILSAAQSDGNASASLGASLVGALLLSLALGWAVSAVLRGVRLLPRGSADEEALTQCAVLLIFVLLARSMEASIIIMALCAGLFLRGSGHRTWIDPRPFGLLGTAAGLGLMVIVGATLNTALLWLGITGALIVLAARFVGKSLAVVPLSMASGLRWKGASACALGLLPMSAVSLSLVADLIRGGLAPESLEVAIIITAVLCLEVIGPLLVAAALRFAGEANDATQPKGPLS